MPGYKTHSTLRRAGTVTDEVLDSTALKDGPKKALTREFHGAWHTRPWRSPFRCLDGRSTVSSRGKVLSKTWDDRLTEYTVYDLPNEIVSGLRLKDQAPLATESETVTEHVPKAEDALAEARVSTAAASCALCGVTFKDALEQRRHAKSDFHHYNLKQRMKGVQTVNEAQFEALLQGTYHAATPTVSACADGTQTWQRAYQVRTRPSPTTMAATSPDGETSGRIIWRLC